MAFDDDDMAGVRILLVEDDHLVGLSIATTLQAFGGTVIGPATDAAGGLDLIGSQPVDAALLDVNLGGGNTSEAVADALRARGIPYVFCTGYGDAGVPAGHAGALWLQKPFGAEQLVRAVRNALNRKA